MRRSPAAAATPGNAVTVRQVTYPRFRESVYEFMKFAVIGVVCIFVTNAIYDLLYLHLGLGLVLSSVIATVVAAVGTYLGNRQFAWGASPASRLGRNDGPGGSRSSGARCPARAGRMPVRVPIGHPALVERPKGQRPGQGEDPSHDHHPECFREIRLVLGTFSLH